jgi:hypothetical protein
MIHTSQKNKTEAQSLIECGIIKTKSKSKITGYENLKRSTIIASFEAYELAQDLELRSKVHRVQTFIKHTKAIARKAKCKFAARDFILNAMIKEIDSVIQQKNK